MQIKNVVMVTGKSTFYEKDANGKAIKGMPKGTLLSVLDFQKKDGVVIPNALNVFPNFEALPGSEADKIKPLMYVELEYSLERFDAKPFLVAVKVLDAKAIEGTATVTYRVGKVL